MVSIRDGVSSIEPAKVREFSRFSGSGGSVDQAVQADQKVQADQQDQEDQRDQEDWKDQKD